MLLPLLLVLFTISFTVRIIIIIIIFTTIVFILSSPLMPFHKTNLFKYSLCMHIVKLLVEIKNSIGNYSISIFSYSYLIIFTKKNY